MRGTCNSKSNNLMLFISNVENTSETIKKAFAKINVSVCKGICKCNGSKFRDGSLNMTKFTKLKQQVFMTDEICLTIDISHWKITLKFFAEWED